MAPALIALPLEIIEIILADVPFSAHYALLHTCRGFYRLTRPKIYRKIHLHLSTEPETIEASKTQLVLLCRTICRPRRPRRRNDVASLVEEFDVQGSKPLTVLPQLCHQEEYLSWEPRTLWGQSPSPISDLKYWRWDQLQKGNTDVLIAIMISHMTFMRILRLGFDIWSGSPCLSACLKNLHSLECAELLAPSTREDRGTYHEMLKSSSGVNLYDARQLRALLSLYQVEKSQLPGDRVRYALRYDL